MLLVIHHNIIIVNITIKVIIVNSIKIIKVNIAKIKSLPVTRRVSLTFVVPGPSSLFN